MKTWKQAMKDAAVVGSFAAATSLGGLMLRARKEDGSPWAAANAPSHWLWGRPALYQNAPSLRYTATGVLIHSLSGGMWGLLHEKVLGERARDKSFPQLLGDAAMTTAVAALVDFALVPQRLTPGFQKRLSLGSLVRVYGLFALGLAAGSWLVNRVMAERQAPAEAANDPSHDWAHATETREAAPENRETLQNALQEAIEEAGLAQPQQRSAG